MISRILRLSGCCALTAAAAWAAGESAPQFIDLSVTVAQGYPVNWPAGWPYFQINHYLRIGPQSPYNSDIVAIDGHTGTQLDVPAHSVPRPGSGLPSAGPAGAIYTDNVPAWQLVGEACVIDVRELLDRAPNGHSPLVRNSHVESWEKRNRALRFGDVALFRSGYTDQYYRPLPEGRRFLADPLQGAAPAWPDPDADVLEGLARRGLQAAGVDSPSMGPIPDLSDPVHLAGLKHGMVYTEAATGLGRLPATGAFYCVLSPKHQGAIGSEARAFAVVGEPLARELIESARNKRVADLSVTLSPDLPLAWPGAGVGNHRQPFLTFSFLYIPTLGNHQHMHMFDSHSGTHLVPPSYALPEKGFDNRAYDPVTRRWLADYEKEYGARGASEMTVEKVPVNQTCGWARVIDVQRMAGSIHQSGRPASPEITEDHIRQYEARHGSLKPGEIVLFRSGYSDRCLAPGPRGNACMKDPLDGKSEGWPSPTPGAILYLARKGIRTAGTDGPALGGVDSQKALATYWMLGTQGMAGIEYLTNLAAVPERAYFLFAAVKIAGAHGGHGRALALY
jgi:kynurenine formamidase